MKKLLFALGIALSIGVTNAASFNWIVTGVNLPDTTTPADGAAVYLFLTAASGNTLDFVPTASLTTISAVETAIKNKTFDGSGAYVVGALNSSGAKTGASGVSTSFGAGDALTAFTVIFNDADYTKATHYMIAEDASGNQELSTSWTSSTGIKSVSWGSQATNGTTWTAVPEPTSGLLVLLGMAGLALRRRRA